MTTADASQMSRKQRFGRAVVATCIAGVLAISLFVIALYVSMRGLEHLPVRVARFALTVALCVWLYRGSNLARGICIVLFGFSGAQAVEGVVRSGGQVMMIASMGAMAVTYLTFAIVLFASPAVSAFLEYQRDSFPTKSKFVRHRIEEVFLWPKYTILKPIDRLTLVLPAGMRDALNFDSGAEIKIPENDDKIYVRLDVGAEVWMGKSSQAYFLPWSDGEVAPKLIQLTPMPEAASECG